MLWYIEVFLELGSGSARKGEGEDQRFPPADSVVRCYLPKLASQAATCRQCSAKDAIPSIPMLGVTTRTPLTERSFITGHRTGVDKVALSKPGVCLRKGKALTSDAIPLLHLQSHLITSPLHPIISSMCLVIRVS
jgi:hypothetical protein